MTCALANAVGHWGTIMIIAHRLSTIKNADWIIVLHEGAWSYCFVRLKMAETLLAFTAALNIL